MLASLGELLSRDYTDQSTGKGALWIPAALYTSHGFVIHSEQV